MLSQSRPHSVINTKNPTIVNSYHMSKHFGSRGEEKLPFNRQKPQHRSRLRGGRREKEVGLEIGGDKGQDRKREQAGGLGFGGDKDAQKRQRCTDLHML